MHCMQFTNVSICVDANTHTHTETDKPYLAAPVQCCWHSDHTPYSQEASDHVHSHLHTTASHCFHVLSVNWMYTVNHKKRDILFLTITLANLRRFLLFLYHFNREEILHVTIIKFITSPDLCVHLTVWCEPVVRTEPVCCEPRHRWVHVSSVSLCRRWRRTFWTLFMIATLKITMLKW